MERVRITNETRYNIGLVSQSKIEYNIRPHAFITLNRDDAEYMIARVPSLFQEGKLRVDNEELAQDMGIIAPGDVSPWSEDAVRKILSGKVAAISEWAKNITDNSIAEVVYDVAMQMDLSASKMRVLKEVWPEKFAED